MDGRERSGWGIMYVRVPMYDRELGLGLVDVRDRLID